MAKNKTTAPPPEPDPVADQDQVQDPLPPPPAPPKPATPQTEPASATVKGRQMAGEPYPAAKYRKVETAELERFPLGYEVKRVETPEQEARLGPEWKNSPAGMDPADR